ncbi:hypothetical protein F4677DRAFT_314355 [Hypoxylon crocopeplum]|nr:hypothetical protein F4677DRAFT_314355 [Hypoxylon crocopeplum]
MISPLHLDSLPPITSQHQQRQKTTPVLSTLILPTLTLQVKELPVIMASEYVGVPDASDDGTSNDVTNNCDPGNGGTGDGGTGDDDTDDGGTGDGDADDGGTDDGNTENGDASELNIKKILSDTEQYRIDLHLYGETIKKHAEDLEKLKKLIDALESHVDHYGLRETIQHSEEDAALHEKVMRMNLEELRSARETAEAMKTKIQIEALISEIQAEVALELAPPPLTPQVLHDLGLDDLNEFIGAELAKAGINKSSLGDAATDPAATSAASFSSSAPKPTSMTDNQSEAEKRALYINPAKKPKVAQKPCKRQVPKKTSRKWKKKLLAMKKSTRKARFAWMLQDT